MVKHQPEDFRGCNNFDHVFKFVDLFLSGHGSGAECTIRTGADRSIKQRRKDFHTD